jgi:hypothetical protein
LWRVTSEEKRELERLQKPIYNSVRRAAEVHRQVLNFTKSNLFFFLKGKPKLYHFSLNKKIYVQSLKTKTKERKNKKRRKKGKERKKIRPKIFTEHS